MSKRKNGLTLAIICGCLAAFPEAVSAQEQNAAATGTAETPEKNHRMMLELGRAQAILEKVRQQHKDDAELEELDSLWRRLRDRLSQMAPTSPAATSVKAEQSTEDSKEGVRTESSGKRKQKFDSQPERPSIAVTVAAERTASVESERTVAAPERAGVVEVNDQSKYLKLRDTHEVLQQELTKIGRRIKALENDITVVNQRRR